MLSLVNIEFGLSLVVISCHEHEFFFLTTHRVSGQNFLKNTCTHITIFALDVIIPDFSTNGKRNDIMDVDGTIKGVNKRVCVNACTI